MQKKFKDFLCASLMGGMLLSFGNIAMANDTTKQETKTLIICKHDNNYKMFDPEKKKERIQNKLSSLVKSGELSQEKANKVADYYYKIAKERKIQFEKMKSLRKNSLEKLVKDGVISQKEAEGIRKVFAKNNHKHMSIEKNR